MPSTLDDHLSILSPEVPTLLKHNRLNPLTRICVPLPVACLAAFATRTCVCACCMQLFSAPPSVVGTPVFDCISNGQADYNQALLIDPTDA
jgi:hypothetical protein